MSGPHMSARVESRGDASVISVSGEVDIATAPQLATALQTAMKGSGLSRIVIDLLDVSFMDSSGLAVLVAFRQRHPDLDVTIVTGEGVVQRLLSTLALDRLFKVAKTVSEAAP